MTNQDHTLLLQGLAALDLLLHEIVELVERPDYQPSHPELVPVHEQVSDIVGWLGCDPVVAALPGGRLMYQRVSAIQQQFRLGSLSAGNVLH